MSLSGTGRTGGRGRGPLRRVQIVLWRCRWGLMTGLLPATLLLAAFLILLAREGFAGIAHQPVVALITLGPFPSLLVLVLIVAVGMRRAAPAFWTPPPGPGIPYAEEGQEQETPASSGRGRLAA